MARTTAISRRIRTKIPAQHARYTGFDPLGELGAGDLPFGVRASASAVAPAMDAWRLPPVRQAQGGPAVMRGVMVGGVIKQRLCAVVN